MRMMAVDYGDVRTGVAICDVREMLAITTVSGEKAELITIFGVVRYSSRSNFL